MKRNTEITALLLLITILLESCLSCPQGPSFVNTEETNNNHHDYWETKWGRTGASWPRQGFEECWANTGDVCALPRQDHLVCLPGSRKGSTANKGWALDPKGQTCQPGVHCLYACEPGYYWTAFNQGETSNYDFMNGPKVGNCDGTWNYGTSTHGVFCGADGNLQLPNEPLCKLGETYVFAENRLNTHIFLCQTVFPGHEIFQIPTLVKPGETVMITTQPKDYWHGPTYDNPTHGDFYVSFAGADIMEACTWDEISPSGASLLPYELGSGVEDNGFVYSTHYYYQQPNSEVPANKVGYKMDIECESSEAGVCGEPFTYGNVAKVDVMKRPQDGTTKVKYIFKPPSEPVKFENIYSEPPRNYMDPSSISGLNMDHSTLPQLPPITHHEPSLVPEPEHITDPTTTTPEIEIVHDDNVPKHEEEDDFYHFKPDDNDNVPKHEEKDDFYHFKPDDNDNVPKHEEKDDFYHFKPDYNNKHEIFFMSNPEDGDHHVHSPPSYHPEKPEFNVGYVDSDDKTHYHQDDYGVVGEGDYKDLDSNMFLRDLEALCA